MSDCRCRWSVVAAFAAWLLAAGAGFLLLWNHSATPGPSASPDALPRLDAPGAAVVMFVHPHCPCTRASIAELSKLASAAPAGTRVRVCVVRLPGSTETSQTEQSARDSGVEVTFDSGELARRAGALTSGWTVITDTQGKLLFAGGLTASRAHEGDNDCRSAAETALRTGEPARATYPVFGCPLFDE